MALAAAVAAAGAETGAAPVHPALNDRFFFGVGASMPKTATDVKLDSGLGIGATIDFERTLGMEESKTVPSALGRIRLGRRWRLEAEWLLGGDQLPGSEMVSRTCTRFIVLDADGVQLAALAESIPSSASRRCRARRHEQRHDDMRAPRAVISAARS
jgi:hypothetical protein